MAHRVVITGLGVVAPNGENVKTFLNSIKAGTSGLEFQESLQKLKFGCQIAGIPKVDKSSLEKYIMPGTLKSLMSTAIIYSSIAAIEAWHDAGLQIVKDSKDVLWDSGAIIGSTGSGVEASRHGIYLVDAGKTRIVGGNTASQSMGSAPSAILGGILGLGNLVTSNSSACITGTEAIYQAYEWIRNGHATKMLAGGCDASSPYIWAPFDSMRLLTRKFNDKPQQASCPMSSHASGLVPGGGSGILLLETLESAQKRGSHIYAEILGGAVNCGGQRNHGSMTASNPLGVQKVITSAIKSSNIEPKQIDAISGHLTSTIGDVAEIKNWQTVLGRSGKDFPYINALKSMIGHCMGGAGAIECVAAILQLHHNFIPPSLNCSDIHPEIKAIVAPEKIPQQTMEKELGIIIKISLGFGDVNGCLVLQKWR